MRTLFSLALIGLCFSLTAQETINYPYNPDGDVDGTIASPDLLDILGVYGNAFTPTEIQIDGVGLLEVIQDLQNQIASIQLIDVNYVDSTLAAHQQEIEGLLTTVQDQQLFTDSLEYKISDLESRLSAEEDWSNFKINRLQYVSDSIMMVNKTRWAALGSALDQVEVPIYRMANYLEQLSTSIIPIIDESFQDLFSYSLQDTQYTLDDFDPGIFYSLFGGFSNRMGLELTDGAEQQCVYSLYNNNYNLPTHTNLTSNSAFGYLWGGNDFSKCLSSFGYQHYDTPLWPREVAGNFIEPGMTLQNKDLSGQNFVAADMSNSKSHEEFDSPFDWQNVFYNGEGEFLEDVEYLADLSHAHLMKANLSNSMLQGINLEGANLQGANLQGAMMELSNLDGADLSFAIFDGEFYTPGGGNGGIVMRGIKGVPILSPYFQLVQSMLCQSEDCQLYDIIISNQ